MTGLFLGSDMRATPIVGIRLLGLLLLVILSGCASEPKRSAPSFAAPIRCMPAASPEMNEYYQKVGRIVRSRWWVHESALGRDVEIVVSLTVDREGHVLEYVVERVSGDRDLDRSVVRAVEEARKAGLPPLPSACGQDRHEFGLIFNPSGR